MKLSHRVAGAAAGVLLLVAAPATAAYASPHGTNANLQCFSGTTDQSVYGGTCTVSKGNASVATLANNDYKPNGDYSGVYVHQTNLAGQALGKIAQLGYTYSGTTSPTAGDLSLNVGVSSSGGGISDVYAYIDAFYCPGISGTVDVINDPSCGIWLGGTYYANWAALVAANPQATVGTDGSPFIVAERTPGEPSATWTISNVQLGKLGR